MTTSHVFIVDINTFEHHLEYMFVGTGAANSNSNAKITGRNIDFNNSSSTKLNRITESNLVDMIADSH